MAISQGIYVATCYIPGPQNRCTGNRLVPKYISYCQMVLSLCLELYSFPHGAFFLSWHLDASQAHMRELKL